GWSDIGSEPGRARGPSQCTLLGGPARPQLRKSSSQPPECGRRSHSARLVAEPASPGPPHRIGAVRDEDVRTACMARLSLLVSEFGEDIPYEGGLNNGFPFRGRRVPFLNYQKGIYRAAVQNGPAALSIQTSSKSPYDDEVVADGFLYAYRAGDVD